MKGTTMRRPMPSPRGTNHAGLFLSTTPVAAYDELPPGFRRTTTERKKPMRRSPTRFSFDAMPGGKAAELILFLKERLSEEDFSEACRLGGLDAGITMDEPAAYSGMRKPAGNFGQDARRRRPVDQCSSEDFASRHPNAAKIKVSR
jgi:hypothetical protein